MKILFALALLSVAGRAGEQCHSASYPSSLTNWSQTFVVPKHDPTRGALQSVTVTVRCSLAGAVLAENPSLLPATYTTKLAFLGSVSRPDASLMHSVQPDIQSEVPFGGFDGQIDFAGPSGIALTNLTAERQSHVSLTGAADLALFTATQVGEVIGLAVNALGTSTATGPGALVVQLNTSGAIEVTVCYGYREVCQSASIPSQPTNWQQARTFAKHDPLLGPLRAVRIRARTTLTGAFGVESNEPFAAQMSAYFAVTTRVLRPDATQALAHVTGTNFIDPVSPYDGVLDFAGPSGVSHIGIQVETSAPTVLTTPLDLALFTAATQGETIALGVSAFGATSVAGGAGNYTVLIQTFAGVEVEVCYDYSARIIPYCFGDGSSLNCPCSNSIPGTQQGCPSSLGVGGELRGSGTAEIGADTLVITASNVPATTTLLLFQGTNAIVTPFGDGLRCVGGVTTRLGSRTASAGSASFPAAGSTISTLGGASGGTTLHYQAWYRNAVAFCTPAAFNLTNGLAIAW